MQFDLDPIPIPIFIFISIPTCNSASPAYRSKS